MRPEENEYEYEIACFVCDSEVDVKVYNDQEQPLFCPMCGEQASVSAFD